FLLLLAPSLAAFLPIAAEGNALFVNGTSERFYIRGIDYQPGGSSKLIDPIANVDNLKRDIPYFEDLGINTIRAYSIDNTADHSEGMKLLLDAGIGLILDTNIPLALIARDDGAECSYNTMYLNEVLATVRIMSAYDNLIGIFAANEVINDLDTTPAAAYVKAVIRDIKTFQRNTGLRTVPVGYSAADIEENRVQSAHYFNCGDDEMARADFYGFNDYSWCGDSSFTISGYDKKVETFLNHSIPLFFSEYGCNKVTPRKFTEVESIYSTDMTHVFSGGLVYEYSQEANDYGLVELSSDNKTVTTKDDFDNLKLQFASVPNPSGDGGYQSDLPHSNCPSRSSVWEASNTIPDTPKGALKYINGVVEPEGNGFDADTQWACIAAGNDVDDSDSASSGSSSGSSSTRSGSSSGSSSTRSGSSTGSSSSNTASS
ncbi:hypothetical protein METBIDRAFT_15547, partial [Metschnikowia bicuspidata var. bicuspidata NRRL YB-4993]